MTGPAGGRTAPPFSRAELQGFHVAVLPDLVGLALRLLFVGLNPGLRSVALGAPFSGVNRFYPALVSAGIVQRPIDSRSGLSDEDRVRLIACGIGITCLVSRATASAEEITARELLQGLIALRGKVAGWRSAVVAVLGTTAFRGAFGGPAQLGRQSQRLAGSELWIVPNPSGRNRHASLADLAGAYREAAVAAGVRVADRSVRRGSQQATPSGFGEGVVLLQDRA